MTIRNGLLLAGVAIVAVTSSSALALDIEEDMAEGISLSVQENETSYKYDSKEAYIKESMTEFVFFPEKDQEVTKYPGDPSCPTGEHMMSEDECLDGSHTYIAGN